VPERVPGAPHVAAPELPVGEPVREVRAPRAQTARVDRRAVRAGRAVARERRLDDLELVVAVGMERGHARVVHAVQHVPPRQLGDARDARQPQPVVVILAAPQVGAERADVVDDRAAQHQRARQDDRRHEQVMVEPPGLRGVQRVVRGRVGIVGHGSPVRAACVRPPDMPRRVHAADRRIAREHPQLRVELARQPDVVRIEERHERRARLGERAVARDGGALVGLRQHAHRRAARARGGDRVVGRAVVDHDDLDVTDALREDAVERLADVGAGVVGRHHDRDRRGHR
jgi:hypothetical protein